MAAVSLSPLEIAAGFPIGTEPGAQPLTLRRNTPAPRAALEMILVSALRSPPCGILFSGGRDSSALLAVAVEVARREGLSEPTAITYTYPGVASAEEQEWQEMVVRHVGLRDWERIPIGTEFDWLGELSRKLLVELGLLWPPNAVTVAVGSERCGGGTVITGVFGDELFDSDLRSAHLRLVAAGRRKPTLRDLARLAMQPLPFAARVVINRRFRHSPRSIPPWLTADAAVILSDELAARSARERITWKAAVRDFERERYPHVIRATTTAIAAHYGASIRHPFGDQAFLESVALDRPRVGYQGRTETMRRLFGDLLPAAILERKSKATFDDAFWGPGARSFLDEWARDGIDRTYVDVDRLAATWARAADPAPGGSRYPGSIPLLHAAWLASKGVPTPVSPTHPQD